MEGGHIVVDSIDAIQKSDITDALARESGFTSAADLIETASHGSGRNVYLIRFHYLAPGAWDVSEASPAVRDDGPTLLQRIRRTAAPARRKRRPERKDKKPR
jgi:hypothetical protein